MGKKPLDNIEKPINQVKKGLNLVIESTKYKYEVGESIDIEACLINDSSNQITFYNKNLQHYMLLKVSKNKYAIRILEYKMGNEWFHVPEKIDYHTLLPNKKSCTMLNNLSSGNQKIEITQPGTYTTSCVLRLIDGYRNKQDISGKEFKLDAWTGILKSNAITIRVISPK